MTTIWPQLERHLLHVQGPSQYVGGEVNSVRKEDAEVKVALAFPDAYKIGMAHLGIQIFYGQINEARHQPDHRCRVKEVPDVEGDPAEQGPLDTGDERIEDH